MIKNSFAELIRLDADIACIHAGQGRGDRRTGENYYGKGRKSNLLYYMLDGERQYCFENKDVFTLVQGDMVFIPISSCYKSNITSDIYVDYYIDFNLEINGETLYINEPFRVIHDDRFKGYFERIIEYNKRSFLKKTELYSLLSEICKIDVKNTFDGEFGSIYAFVVAMEEYPQNFPSVKIMAQMCSMSETSFREKFKQYTGGQTPLEYRNRLRVERADELLRICGFSIDKVAEILGFFDTAHFYHTYKKIRGSTPREVTPRSENQ